MSRLSLNRSAVYKGLILFLFLLFNVETSYAAEEAEPKKLTEWKQTVKHPVLRIKCVTVPPVIDGRLDAVYKEHASPVTLKLISGSNEKPTFPSTAYIISDRSNLYIFTRCLTPFPDAVLAKIHERDKHIYHDETVEIFIDPTNNREDMYFHIMVNAIGTTGDIKNRDDPNWNPDLTVKTGREPKKAWLMEIKIPFKELGIKPGTMNKIWSFNLNRTARPEPKPPLGINDVEIEDTAWSPTYSDSSHRPGMFGYLWLDAGNVVNTGTKTFFRTSIEDQLKTQRPGTAEKLDALPVDGRVYESAIVKEYAVTRSDVFEFAKKPQVTRRGDRVTIQFAVKAFCDATVAVEREDGRIIRHLASGVLGPNAPEPFQKNSLKQTLIWDGKDEKERYVDFKDRCIIRVSLGLNPRFERTLFWSPYRRWGGAKFIAAEEGMYVFENSQVPQLRLYDHSGTYIRTVYPFPANRLHLAAGMMTKIFPHDGKRLPVKFAHPQSTLLTSAGVKYGMFWPVGDTMTGGMGVFAHAIGLHPGKPSLIYIMNHRINRLAGDGTTGGLPLHGTQTCFNTGVYFPPVVGPTSAAVSPDGTHLYLTGYISGRFALHGVARMDPRKDKEPVLFAGVLRRREHGKDNKHFKLPASVDCDKEGRVYVADYLNNRIQVFNESGEYLSTVKVRRPSYIRVNRKTGEFIVLSYGIPNWYGDYFRSSSTAVLTRFSPLKSGKAETVSSFSFQVGRMRRIREMVSAEIDWHTDPPALWLTAPVFKDSQQTMVYTIEKDRLVPKKNFVSEIKKTLIRYRVATEFRQRLYVDPKTGNLYVGEYFQHNPKAFSTLIRIDPETGSMKEIRLPMRTEDAAFDINGYAYLRSETSDYIVRFDPKNWREIPFDYGEERDRFISGLVVPGTPDGGGMTGGFSVSPKGHIVVHCRWPLKTGKTNKKTQEPDDKKSHDPFERHEPQVFPGRYAGHEIHVFDKHGQWIIKDALPGVERTDGLHIDKDDYLYMIINQTRSVDGNRYFNDISCTYMKAKAGKARILTSSAAPVKLPPSERPKRPPDFMGHWLGAAWAEGAEWLHGAVGLNGRSVDNAKVGRNCDCVAKSRSDLDLFRRSFVPEVDHYSLIVLDTNGNPVVRIGRIGNVDDGVPLIPQSGIRNPESKVPRSLGGDEVAIMHAMNVATHTDRRLFIADIGNQRILSIKLDYFATEKVPLIQVEDQEPRSSIREPK